MGGFGGDGGGPGFEMMVPGHLVARIIGKGGETIKALQEETGAKIVIIQDSKDFQEEKPLKITGPPDKVEFAKQRVEQMVQMIQEEHRLLPVLHFSYKNQPVHFVANMDVSLPASSQV